MFKSIPSVLKHAVKVHSNVACRAISSTNSCYGEIILGLVINMVQVFCMVYFCNRAALK